MSSSTRNPWTAAHTDIMERMQGRPIAEIANATGHAIPTVKAHLRDAGIRSFRGRATWTRRDWLLHDAAGLDFQISF
jgi:hypothetical protein